jgi:hypothetical protein
LLSATLALPATGDLWRSVGARKVATFGLETLEAEIDAEKGVVLKHESTNGFDLFRRSGLRDAEHECGRGA